MSLQMTVRMSAILAFVLLSVAAPRAQQTYGGDVYESGANASITATAARDAFVAGFSAQLDGNIGGDGHAAGFDVDVDGTIGSDLYASGATVTVGGPVGEDVTVMGATVRLRRSSSVGGNARLMGGSVTVEAPIAGSLVASGGTIRLDAPVDGDAALNGGDLIFGDGARIAGTLTYSGPEQIDIPASVAAPERVRFVKTDAWSAMDDWREIAEGSRRSLLPTLFGKIAAFAVTLAFLLVIAALFLTVAPATVESGRRRIVERPGATFLAGFLTLSALFGLVPVSAMTLVGIPLIPIVVLLIVLGWTFAYVLGAYALSLRVATAFWEVSESTVAQLLVLAVGLLVLAVLNFIPIAGWLVNFTIVLLGLGAIVRLLTGWMAGTPRQHLAETPADAPAA
ncbi:hypothetical protein [Oricola sp.]|uniref:hypothetical protein n=1 Tax=Oricola sp. TaxID=1979950 RepID=UPI0025D7F90E|nr:hypothetical protein [Oricola sp.]MCI5076466.1 hypothetical protein [Oricola sp.]